ncbi:PAS domain S-box protein [Lysobacter sp. A3-1-A15]|uniref:PAS domain S-box protein n=1 Tax=Novilysobacter viscosus TaxID=3098602 RepID=UPI002EDAC765
MTGEVPFDEAAGEAERRDPAARTRAEDRLNALITATSDVVYRMSADWSEMQPLDGRGLVVSNDAPIRDWMQRNIPSDEHPRVRAAIARAVAGKTVFELEHRVLGEGGSETWTHSRAVPVLDAHGDVVEWFGLARDITKARTAEEALRDSEQRFRSVFEQSTGGIAQVDLQGRFVLVNDRYCDIVGRPREQLLAMRMQDLTHPDDVPQNVNLFAQVAQGLIPDFTIEKRYLRPDGSAVWVQNAVSAIRGPDGRVRYITAVVADITYLRTAEENQGALAAQRQLALDAARLGWWQSDPATGLVSHDARYAEIYGIDNASPRPVEEIGRLLHPEDAPRLWAAIDAAVQPDDPQPYQVEYRINRPDGAVRWLEARGIASFEGHGESRRVTRFVGTVADVTERRLAEELLRENEARFRLMADASPATLWLTDPDGRCVFLSRQWYELTGQTNQDALGLGWTDATHPDDREQVADTFLQANAARAFFRTEYRLRTAGGDYRWAIDLGRPWFSETGEYAGMVGAVFDIDDRKRAEEGLEEANRRKDQFLATLAHELRNPLAPISNALQVWPLVEQQPEEARRIREVMERQVRQMVRLIDDLLDVSRINRGKIELRRERLDLGVAVAAAVEALQPFIDAHRHQLVVVLPDHPLHVDADLGRLVQVFGNLLNNAAKYTSPGGHVRLEARGDGMEAVVTVRDDGAGIPADMLAPVFEMFTQVDQSLGRSHGGLGIGLTLVKSLVELHEGTVEARSEGPGRGSEFIVRLPLAPADDAPAGPAASLPGSLPDAKRHRVLVVDDVEASADTLALMLKGLGQEARAVYDGASALEAIATFRPAVAFIDIAMPGMDGYEVAGRIRQRLGSGPVLVALTGYGQEDDRRRAFDAGFDHHLVKPTSVEALHQVLLGLPDRA